VATYGPDAAFYKAEPRRQRLSKLVAALKTERSSFDAHWRDIGDNIQPRRARFQFTDNNRGTKVNQNIIDSTATFAARTLAAGLHSGMTSPSRPWFRLTTPDPDLAELDPVKEYLHIVGQRMATIFLRSNLYNALPLVYGDIGTFGTAAMLVLENDDDVIRCIPCPIGSYYLGNDANLKVTTFAREFRLTVRQLVEQFGEWPSGDRHTEPMNWENFSPKVKEAWRDGKYEEWVDVCHVILPNAGYDEQKLEGKYKKFLSVYYEYGYNGGSSGYTANDDVLLSESGFDEFPVLAPRWEVTGEDVYGTNCPGMTALGDVKALQKMKKRLLQAIDKKVNPPMVAPTTLRTGNPTVIPGEITWVDEGPNRTFRPAYDVTLDLSHLHNEIADVKGSINQAFFVDLFRMLDSLDRKDITATAVLELKEEKMLVLGPVIEQCDQDLNDPLIDRTFGIMARRGLLPEAPEELHGVPLKIEYISVMAQAQKSVGLASMDRLSLYIGSIVKETGDRSVLDKWDVDQSVDEYAGMTGVPPRVIRADDAVQSLRQSRAQAAAAAQKAEQIAKLAPAAKQLSETNTTGDNGLTALLGSGGGGTGIAGLLPAGAGV
jgi:hypothetical protein